jgi:uncharacterized OB-fold protein
MPDPYWEAIGKKVEAKKKARLVSRICKTCGTTITCYVWNASKMCRVCNNHRCRSCSRLFYGPRGNCPECKAKVQSDEPRP